MLLKYNDVHVLIVFGDEIDFGTLFISSCHSADFKCSENILLVYFIQSYQGYKVFNKSGAFTNLRVNLKIPLEVVQFGFGILTISFYRA